jgi:hypothetical protein
MKDGLHIYSAASEHDEVIIIGTHDGLRALRDALTAAIERNGPKKACVFASDGEGYWVCIAPVDPATFDSMAEHYGIARSIADDFAVSGKWPQELKFDWMSSSRPNVEVQPRP